MSKKDKIEKDKEETCCCKNQENHCDENKECNCNEDGCCNEDECCCCHDEVNIEELLTQRIKILEDTLLRNQAELLNYKKRKDEETARILKYAETDILEGFLPILDNFERAISMDDNNFGDETSKFLEGFRMVYKQTKSLLEKFEVKEIECIGKEFDPTYAQAVVVEKDETKESGVVLEVLQKGYMYKDKVIRPSMVKVSE